MIGAIIGDIVGSRFEFDNIKTKEFDFFTPECRFTDDTVMTLAIAKSILEADRDWDKLGGLAVKNMRELGRQYCYDEYGLSFREWLYSDDMGAYNSFGNGAAMRVSPCGYAANSIEEAKLLSRIVTEVTHNHPEGIKGAEAVAVCVFLIRAAEGRDYIEHRNYIRKYVQKHYYSVKFDLHSIRASYDFDETCQNTVPQAIRAYLESGGFEGAVRNAVSIGGDSDTLAAITGSIAGAAYGVPIKIRKQALTFLDERLTNILLDFESVYTRFMPRCDFLIVPEVKVNGEDIIFTDVVFSRERRGYAIRMKFCGIEYEGWAYDGIRSAAYFLTKSMPPEVRQGARLALDRIILITMPKIYLGGL